MNDSLKIGLTWDSENGEFETTGNSEWKIVYAWNKMPPFRGMATVFYNEAESIEILFTSGRFDDGTWCAVVNWEMNHSPMVLEGDITFEEVVDVRKPEDDSVNSVWYEGLNEKLTELFESLIEP